MGKIDIKTTEKISAFLSNENPTEKEAMACAELLASLNHNKALFLTISRRPLHFVNKIKYELKKFLPSLLDGVTMEEVVKMDEELTPVIRQHIEEEADEEEAQEKELPLRRAGIRADHDQLPDEIKSIWGENAARWKNIKKLYYELQEIKQPCDRYERLKLLKESWYQYRDEMNRYDSFVIGTQIPSEEKKEEATVDFKDIGAARAYITKNIDKLIELKDGEDLDAYAKLRAKVQERVNILVNAQQEFKKETVAKLRLAGIDNVPHE